MMVNQSNRSSLLQKTLKTCSVKTRLKEIAKVDLKSDSDGRCNKAHAKFVTGFIKKLMAE